MKRKIICVLILLVFISISGYQVEGAMNKEELLDYLSKLEGSEYELIDYTDDFKENRGEDFAEIFYQNFSEGNVEFVEAKHKTDDMADVELQNKLGMYPDFCFYSGEIMGDKDDFMVHNRKIPHYNFRIYEVDFNNNGKIETVFYSDGYMNSETTGEIKAKYDILSSSKVTEEIDSWGSKYWMGGILVRPEYKGEYKERTSHFNGIINYKNIYYIYEIWIQSTATTITFYRWNDELKKVLSENSYTIIHEEDRE